MKYDNGNGGPGRKIGPSLCVTDLRRKRRQDPGRRARPLSLEGSARRPIASESTQGFTEQFEQLDELLVTPGRGTGWKSELRSAGQSPHGYARATIHAFGRVSISV